MFQIVKPSDSDIENLQRILSKTNYSEHEFDCDSLLSIDKKIVDSVFNKLKDNVYFHPFTKKNEDNSLNVYCLSDQCTDCTYFNEMWQKFEDMFMNVEEIIEDSTISDEELEPMEFVQHTVDVSNEREVSTRDKLIVKQNELEKEAKLDYEKRILHVDDYSCNGLFTGKIGDLGYKIQSAFVCGNSNDTVGVIDSVLNLQLLRLTDDILLGEYLSLSSLDVDFLPTGFNFESSGEMTILPTKNNLQIMKICSRPNGIPFGSLLASLRNKSKDGTVSISYVLPLTINDNYLLLGSMNGRIYEMVITSNSWTPLKEISAVHSNPILALGILGNFVIEVSKFQISFSRYNYDDKKKSPVFVKKSQLLKHLEGDCFINICHSLLTKHHNDNHFLLVFTKKVIFHVVNGTDTPLMREFLNLQSTAYVIVDATLVRGTNYMCIACQGGPLIILDYISGVTCYTGDLSLEIVKIIPVMYRTVMIVFADGKVAEICLS
ncbi:hypothetical protein RCL1_001544 [Eukaryota sp. TZLM3-RCL]